MRLLWNDDNACRQLSVAGRRVIGTRLSPEFYDEQLLKLIPTYFGVSAGRHSSS
jgi:hypothetical protein